MNNDLINAADGVHLLVKRLQGQLMTNQKKLDTLQKRQRQKLDDMVHALIPAITPTVRDHLREHYPAFMEEVDGAFERHLGRWARLHKLFFEVQSVSETLDWLRMHMRQYLEQTALLPYHDEIDKITADAHRISMQLGDAYKLLQPIQRAADMGVTKLDPEAKRAVKRLAERRTHLETKSTDNDNSDLWIWMMTDIPTSFRTLLLDSIHGPVHGSTSDRSSSVSTEIRNLDGEFGGAGATGTFAEPSSDISVTEVDQIMIATDDSLGVFS